MSDFLQTQMSTNKLTMPVGLAELMTDISREVLRSQPENIYQFITEYLEALLDAREALSIACHVCGDLCSCLCIPDMDYELHCIGLSDEDVVKVKNIIQEHFDKDKVNEANIMVKLAKRTSITEPQLAEVQKAIHRAFKRYLLKRKGRQVSFGTVSESSIRPVREESVSSQSVMSDFYKPMSNDDVKNDTQLMPPNDQCTISDSIASLAGSYVHEPSRLSIDESEDEEDLSFKKRSSVSSLSNVFKSYLHSFTKHNVELERIGNDVVDNDKKTFKSRDDNSLSSDNDSEEINDRICNFIFHEFHLQNANDSPSTSYNSSN